MRRRRRGFRPHSWAAFAPEEVEDARRAAPDVDLADWAAARGLRHEGDGVVVDELVAAQPRHPQFVFGASVGLVAPHRAGVVAHALRPIGFRNSSGGGAHISSLRGDFHGTRFRDPRGWWTFLPLVGWIFEITKDTGEWPFPPLELVAPSTVVALAVPEASFAPWFWIGTAERLPSGHPRLTAEGAHGLRIHTADDLDDARRAALFGGAARALAAIDAPFVEARLHHGQLLVRRSGFARPGGELDAFVDGAVAFADALAAGAVPQRAPGTFADPLPPNAPERPMPKDRGLKLGPVRISRPMGAEEREGIDPDGWGTALARAAEDLGLVGEDPAALVARHPRIPVPGRARGVLRGVLPGGIDGRLAVYQQRGHDALGRTAVLLAAPAGVADTGPLGTLHEATGLRVAVVDGIVALWNVDRAPRLDADGTARRAAEAARDLGLLV